MFLLWLILRSSGIVGVYKRQLRNSKHVFNLILWFDDSCQTNFRKNNKKLRFVPPHHPIFPTFSICTFLKCCIYVGKKGTCDLAPFQMFCFYIDFGVKDTSIWVDLSFDKAKELLKTTAASEDARTTTLSFANCTIPTISFAPPKQTYLCSFNIWVKNSAIISVCTRTCR